MKIFATIATLLLAASTGAVAAEFHVDRTQKNLVRFISDAPLENFDGTTDGIDGYVYWKGDSLPPDAVALPSSQLYLEVDLGSLDTGIGLRNRHMREEYLETDKYPYAQYSAKLTDIVRPSDTAYAVSAEGKMTIHGQERPLNISARVTPQGEGFRVQCGFAVNLNDYKIKIPKFMFLKLGEVIQLELDFYVKRVPDSK